MKRILSIATCCALVMGLAATALAQKPGAGSAVPKPAEKVGKPGGLHPGAKNMFKELNLTPAQQERIQAIVKKYGEQMRALKNSGLPKEQIMQKMRALKEAEHREIRAVLTPAQQAQWDEMMKKRANRKKDGGGVKPPPPPPKPKGGG